MVQLPPLTNGVVPASSSIMSSPPTSRQRSPPPRSSKPPPKPWTSRSSAGPTLEISPTQQVCWSRMSPPNTPARSLSSHENFGASKLAEKFGIKGYPAVFVDDVLVAAPREFGYFGEVEGTGRYAPWRNAASQEKFKADLTRMIDLILAGEKTSSPANTFPTPPPPPGNRRSSPVQTYRSFRPSPLRRSALRPRCPRRVLGHLVPAVPFHSGMARRTKSQAWR